MFRASSAVPIPLCTLTPNQGESFGSDEEIPVGGITTSHRIRDKMDFPMQPVDPPSPNYVPGPEHPPSPIEIPYVPEPEYPEYLVPSEDKAPMEDQPLPADASPIALSPGYEPFKDEKDDEEEEEHLAPADSSDIPVVDTVPSAEDTEAFETDESAPTPRAPQIRIPFAQTHLHKARKTVRPEPPMSSSMEARIAEYAAAPTPPLPVVSSPLPLPSPLTTSPTDAGAPLGYRAAGIRMRAAATSPPLLLPPTSPRTVVPEAEMLPRKRACLTTPAPGYEIRESLAAGAARQPGPTPEVDTWDKIVEAMMEIAPTTLEGVDQRVTELDTTVRQMTEEFQFEERVAAIEAMLGTGEMFPTRRARGTTYATANPPSTTRQCSSSFLIDQGVAAAFGLGIEVMAKQSKGDDDK
ncbi:hypothetical protein Tco_1564281 [Tanacetum coccineum]